MDNSESLNIHGPADNRGKFNNASALGRSLYGCPALHVMNKDRYQSTSARRALALLNSPQVFYKRSALFIPGGVHFTHDHMTFHS